MGDNNEKNAKIDATITSFEFQIRDIKGESPMKNIPLSSLPSFQGLAMKILTLSYLNLMSYARAMIMF